ncbi:MAG: putative transporter [Bacteroidales bacterium]|jgi:putative transport protein|nr:putative transporter [Bacteroidales bacterium]
MDWLINLFTGSGVAHTVLLFALVITIGILLGKVKIFGISLGIAFVLFAGLAAGHFGLTVNHEILEFVREFGLILFVYSIGLQMGPSFAASFKKSGITLNMLAMGVVFLGATITVIIHYIMDIPIQTMVGILSGAVTNTPGLGAAQQTFLEINNGVDDPSIALGYAVAYPLAVVGIISCIILMRGLFKIDMEKEWAKINDKAKSDGYVELVSLEIKNPSVYGKDINEIHKMFKHQFVISRVLRANAEGVEIASSSTVLNEGDKVFLAMPAREKNAVSNYLGVPISMQQAEWEILDKKLISRRILITKSGINGKQLRALNLRSIYGVNITRVNRSGVDIIADACLSLQVGDKVTVVGTAEAIKKVEHLLGNQMKRLNEPNLVPIFIGIFLGILVGSIPFAIPGIPQPIKLGLAGGPLIVAILISIFGPKYRLVTYTTISANLMLREIGICLFLACVGIGAGGNFVSSIVNGGYAWIGYGFIITMLPLLIIGIIARVFCKLNYFELIGLLAGSTTDPPAIAYSNAIAGNDTPSVSYATVYPLTMFLRVLSAQMLILFF